MSAPRGGYDYFRPTPPQRGSFPIDHNGDCTQFMNLYLNCIKSTKGTNAPGCRILAKDYLNCRMENDLMNKDDWVNLGLPDDASHVSSITGAQSKDSPPQPTTSK